jgi:hypothetical protein
MTMEAITNWEMRLILDRNRNALDGRPAHEVGADIQPGLYWDPANRVVVPVTARQRAERPLVSIHDNPNASMDDVVREVAMGGGGHSGRPTPYEQARATEKHHH